MIHNPVNLGMYFIYKYERIKNVLEKLDKVENLKKYNLMRKFVWHAFMIAFIEFVDRTWFIEFTEFLVLCWMVSGLCLWTATQKYIGI